VNSRQTSLAYVHWVGECSGIRWTWPLSTMSTASSHHHH